MASVTANGITIEYESDGTGTPVLFIMGLGAQLTAWPDALLARVAERGCRVIRHDNRDVGLSTDTGVEVPSRVRIAKGVIGRRTIEAAYGLPDMAADAVGLLDALDIERAHLVGVSMGGMIAQTLACAHPDRVGSLTSIMSNTGDRRNGGSTMPMMAFMARRPQPTEKNAVRLSVDTYMRIGGPHSDESEIRAIAEAAVARSLRPHAVPRQMAAVLASTDRTDALGSVTAPTLVVHGLLDELVKPSGGIATARAVPGSRLLMFPDMAHDLPAPRLDEIGDAIVANIDRAR